MVKYGSFEQYPARFSDYEAWVLIKNEWRKFNAAEVRNSVHTLDEAEFKKVFGQLPDLPGEAFKA